jgi:hypothetical protein
MQVCIGAALHIGPGWHGSKRVAYGHHHLGLSSHGRKEEEALERSGGELLEGSGWREGVQSGCTAANFILRSV